MNINEILQNISILEALRILLDVSILWLVFYIILRLIRNNERTIQLFKGIVFLLIAKQIAKFLGLSSTEYLANLFMNWGFIAIIIIFQPEIRNILEKLGTSSLFSRFGNLSVNAKEELVKELMDACEVMSKEKTGALIAIEQTTPMNNYIKTGTEMNAEVTSDLLRTVFQYGTPLHDGAAVIQGNRLAAAAVYFPPTIRELPNQYGARHRAAIGMSEQSDCIILIVSEETGHISVARNGNLLTMDVKGLKEYLDKEMLQREDMLEVEVDEKDVDEGEVEIDHLEVKPSEKRILAEDGKVIPLEVRYKGNVTKVGEQDE